MDFYSDADFQPEISVGYLVRRANQLGAAALEPVFAAEGLNLMQWTALVSIWFGTGSTAAELARELGHDKGAMTRLVDAIEARGWIVRERTGRDRRCITLVLTPAGEAVALRCRAQVVQCWNAWLADWRREDVATLVALLQRLRDTLAQAAPCV